jgi:hypothetical protein
MFIQLWLREVAEIARLSKRRHGMTHGSHGAELVVPMSQCAQNANAWNAIKYIINLSPHRL